MDTTLTLLGFDIGGTKIAACLGKSDGTIIESRRIDNRDRAPEEVLPEMVQTGNELLEAADMTSKDIWGVGIGCPGPIDIPNGLVTCPTNMKRWIDVPVRDYLAEKFSVPAYFDNDANAGALAEWFFGSGQGCKHMLYLTMSTGIGGGLIVNGHLVHGKSFLAGEVGHMVLEVDGLQCNCGLKGCYEAYCGGLAVANRMRRELADQPDHEIVVSADGKLENITFPILREAVKTGNEYAVNLWDEICLRNAQAMGILINTFSPEVIVLGTIAIASGDLFMDPVKKYLPRFAWEEPLSVCELKVSALQHQIGEYAGLCVGLNALYEQGKWTLPWS